MFKRYKKQLIISTIVILLPILAGILLWNKLPDTIATHWGVDGQADGWSRKGIALFAAPVFLAFMNLFCVWITDLTNRGNEQSPKVMNTVFFIMPLLSLLTNGFVYALALGKVWNMNSVMPIFLGLLFMLIGNYLPKCTQNTTIGIKVIWALNNEENWNATHRFAGKLWFAAGAVSILSVLLPTKIGFPIMFIALMGAGAGTTLYSYLYYRKQLEAGTAVLTKKIPMDKTTRIVRRISWVAVILILIGIFFILFTGSIDYEFREDALVMDASFYAPITLRYENVEKVEYREGNISGQRVGGFGSFRLLLGFFENEEFGTYNRYTYYKPESCIVVTARGKTIVFSGKDSAETRQLYDTLLNRIG